MDEDDEYGPVEEGWFAPQKWSPMCLVRAVSLFATGVTGSLHAAVDYLDTTILAHIVHSEEARAMADQVRLDLERLPEA